VTESAPPVPSAAVGPLTLLLPKPFASDIKDKDLGTREETLEEEVDFGKNKGGGVDKEIYDDDDDEEEEDEEVPLVEVVEVEVEESVNPNDRRELAMDILELNDDGGGSGGKGCVAKRFLVVGEAGRDRDEGVGDRSEDFDGDVDTGEEDNNKK
jgi:hypothetical protein